MITEQDGLAGSPLMFVFVDVSSLPRHRRLYEDEFGLAVVENQFHPPHEHHGLVKYDAGGTLLAVNLFAERKFRGEAADGVTIVVRVADRAVVDRRGAAFTDADGHHYVFAGERPADPALRADICELRFAVTDPAASLIFYRDVLGLTLVAEDEQGCRYRTGSLDLVTYRSEHAPDGRPIRYNAFLGVFYAADVGAAERALRARGLRFSSPSGFSDIGGTARFRDPDGHTFCLYQPSVESLTWGSAAKVLDLMSGGAAAHR
ncbi:VOC family protein [Nucisporomicrobium flavum]|uniref:VOC family protein n=1 Tax=Nucisporomicrobium flavum TaxID=2785915 RepID=UPI003C305875